MPDTVTIAEQIACVDRELAIRGRVYPRWVEKGKLRAEAADLEIKRMQAVRESLLRVQAELPARPPGVTATGDLFGPAKVRADERRKVLSAVLTIAGEETMLSVMDILKESQNATIES